MVYPAVEQLITTLLETNIFTRTDDAKIFKCGCGVYVKDKTAGVHVISKRHLKYLNNEKLEESLDDLLDRLTESKILTATDDTKVFKCTCSSTIHRSRVRNHLVTLKHKRFMDSNKHDVFFNWILKQSELDLENVAKSLIQHNKKDQIIASINLLYQNLDQLK